MSEKMRYEENQKWLFTIAGKTTKTTRKHVKAVASFQLKKNKQDQDDT